MFNNEILAKLRARYGSFDPNKLQTRRRQYYSYQSYGTAGATAYTFFGTALGASNLQLTNIQQAGRLDNDFIVKSIKTRLFINDPRIDLWRSTGTGVDTTTLYSDFVNGFIQAGFLQFEIGSKIELQLPSPFLYCPPGFGEPELLSAGAIDDDPWVTSFPYATQNGGKQNAYMLKPEKMVSQDQNFKVTINYPTGAVPVIGSLVLSTSTAQSLYIGIELDGLEIRNAQ